MSAAVVALQRHSAPHDEEAERLVLGAAMLWSCEPSARAIHEIVGRLDPAQYYRPAHAAIAEAMVRLRDRGDAIDVANVWAELGSMSRQQSVGGLGYLGDLTDRSGTPTATLRLERRVRDLATRRSFIAAYRTGLAILEADGEDVRGAADDAMAAVLAVRGHTPSKGPRHIGDAARDAYDDMVRVARGDTSAAFRTGIRALDAVLDPLESGELVVIGARPSTGKTSLAMAVVLAISAEVARRVQSSKGSVLFFSLETTDRKLARRAIASLAGVGLSIVSGREVAGIDAVRRVQAGVDRLHRLPIWIDDRFGLPVSEMRATCRAHKRDHGLSLIVVDYLQLLKGTAKRESKRVDEVAEVSRELKALAKEFDCPVIALAQLNRAVESRADKRPTLADLRESGQIEQDADKVVLLHRENKQARDLVAIVAKQRDGAADIDATLDFDGPTTGFAISLEDQDDYDHGADFDE